MHEPCSGIDIEQLVLDHHADVYRYAYRLCGGAGADAEDLTQQVFLLAQQNLQQLRDVSAARSWLLAICRNAFLKALKQSQAVMPSGQSQLQIEEIAETLTEETQFDEEALQQALNELPENFRVVLLAYYFEDCSYREIAERFKLPQGTVMSRLARAKDYLRAKLLETHKDYRLFASESASNI